METTVVEKEGTELVGSPTFKELENGRVKCVETGHEMLPKDKDSYSRSKRCRLGLIDFALSRNKPPLTMFKQDPTSRSKLICKLTGDTINKSEEHIWKHLNGKRFLNKLEQMEAGKLTTTDNGENEKKKKRGKEVEQIISQVRDFSDDDSDSEEAEFWMPPVGDHLESGQEDDEVDGSDVAVEDDGEVSEELSERTKRMAIEIGPSSFASRKKKSKKGTAC